MNETEIIKKAKRLDVAAFEILVKTYEKEIFKSAYWFIGNKDDAFDLTQEVFIDAFKKIKSFRQECSFLTWLNWILLDRVSRKRRKKKTINKYIIPFQFDEDDKQKEHKSHIDKNPINILAQEERQKLILEKINSLENKYRMPIVLCDLEKLSYRKASEILKCSESALKTRLFRARVKLKELFDNDPDFTY